MLLFCVSAFQTHIHTKHRKNLSLFLWEFCFFSLALGYKILLVLLSIVQIVFSFDSISMPLRSEIWTWKMSSDKVWYRSIEAIFRNWTHKTWNKRFEASEMGVWCPTHQCSNLTLISRTVPVFGLLPSCSAVEVIEFGKFSLSLNGKTTQCGANEFSRRTFVLVGCKCTRLMLNLNFREWFVNVMNASNTWRFIFYSLVFARERDTAKWTTTKRKAYRFSLNNIQLKWVHPWALFYTTMRCTLCSAYSSPFQITWRAKLDSQMKNIPEIIFFPLIQEVWMHKTKSIFLKWPTRVTVLTDVDDAFGSFGKIF